MGSSERDPNVYSYGKPPLAIVSTILALLPPLEKKARGD